MKYIISKVEILYLYHATLLSRQHTNAVLGLKSMLDRLPKGVLGQVLPRDEAKTAHFFFFPQEQQAGRHLFSGQRLGIRV